MDTSKNRFIKFYLMKKINLMFKSNLDENVSIKLNEIAINKDLEYYIILEDDVKSLVDHNKIIEYVDNSLNTLDIDLLLLEQGENLEKNVTMKKNTNNLYRIYGGGNNTGAYLCKNSFGKKLIEHWKQKENEHCDHSWRELWKDNNVYFHRPQLFNQQEGESNQNDVDYRGVQKPFDFIKYDKENSKTPLIYIIIIIIIIIIMISYLLFTFFNNKIKSNQ